ncbi:hypothetical protein JXI42_06730 [bacterium]|nr:hypothetical protein [bacterium]
MDTYKEIFDSDLPNEKKLAKVFNEITNVYVQHAEQGIELNRALCDDEALIKEQIKLRLMKHVGEIFNGCYQRIYGRRAWDE